MQTSVYTPSAPNYTTALDFDSSQSDYIQIYSGTVGNLPPSFSIGAGDSQTISCWIKSNVTTSNNFIWLQRGTNPYLRLFLNYDSGTNSYRAGFSVRDDLNVEVSELSDSTNLVNRNQWNHIAAVIDRANAKLYVYVNGVVTGTGTALGSLGAITQITDINIGRDSAAGGRFYFDGQISNAAIFNSALSASQVSTLLNFGTPETNISFSPQAWWKLDNTTTGIQDSSGNGNNGTNNGTTQVNTSVAVVPSWKIPSALTIPTINYTTALDFNRSEYDNLNTTPVTDFDTGDVSFSVWVFKDDGSTNGFVFNNSYNSGKAGITVAINDLERVSIKRSTRTHLKSTGYRNFGFTTNKWHQIAFTYDDSTHILRTFLDGQFKEEWSVPSGTLAASTTVCVGGREPGSGNAALFFDGKISNLTIFNSKLEDSDINTLYNSGQPLSDLSSFTTLATWWKLDNLTTGIQDSAGSINLTNDGATQVTSDVYAENIPVNGVSTTLPSTALQQSDLQFDSPYSNYSLSFDGSDKVVIPNTSNIFDFGTNDFTVSLWCKGDGVAASQYIIGSTDSSFRIGRHASVPATGKGGARFRIGSGFNTITAVTTNIDDGNWHNVIVKRESGGVSIFTDGQAQQLRLDNGTDVSTPYTMNDSISVGSNLFIGSYTAGAEFWIGKVDETAFWSVALTEAQVLEIYNNGRPKDLSTFSGNAPISWWRLGENAYFDNNSFVVPNSISGAPNGTGSGTITTMISADAPGTYANGVGENLDILDRVGEAPLSTSNSQSYNMIPDNKTPYVPEYVGLQTNNIYSMDFDSASLDYIDTNYILDVTSDFSVSTWIKIDGDSNHNILGTREQTTGASVSKGFTLLLNSSKQIYARIFTTTSSITQVNAGVIQVGQWFNVVATYVASTKTLKIYRNGIEMGSVIGTSAGVTSPDNLSIGRVGIGGIYGYFDGKIDEVAIFDTALNAGQIKNDIYNASLPLSSNKTADLVNNPNLPNPVAWYRMGD